MNFLYIVVFKNQISTRLTLPYVITRIYAYGGAVIFHNSQASNMYNLKHFTCNLFIKMNNSLLVRLLTLHIINDRTLLLKWTMRIRKVQRYETSVDGNIVSDIEVTQIHLP